MSNTPKPPVSRSVVLAVAAIVLGLLAYSVVGCGDDSDHVTSAPTSTSAASVGTPTTTTQTTPTQTDPRASSRTGEPKSTVRFHSRHIVHGVKGTATLRPGKKLVTLSVSTTVPDRRFTMFIYTHRGHGIPIGQGLYAGHVTQTLHIPLARLAKYRYLGLVVVTKRPARHHHRAHRAIRVVARASVAALINGLLRQHAPPT